MIRSNNSSRTSCIFPVQTSGGHPCRLLAWLAGFGFVVPVALGAPASPVAPTAPSAPVVSVPIEIVALYTDGKPTATISDSSRFATSADGRYVAFDTELALVAEDTNGLRDVYVLDRFNNIIVRASVGSGGDQANDISSLPAISGDGQRVVFRSNASNLVHGDDNNLPDIYLYELGTRQTRRVSVTAAGYGVSDGEGDYPAIAGNGCCVSFWSDSPTLTGAGRQIVVSELATGHIEVVSRASGPFGAVNEDLLDRFSWLSDDGRYVVFASGDGNLVPGDTNGYTGDHQYDGNDVFVRDRSAQTTERVSVRSDGQQTFGGISGRGNSAKPVISGNGRYVSFNSEYDDLVEGDTNGQPDVFVHDRNTHQTIRVSVSTAGVQGNDSSGFWIALPSPAPLSTDGRYVAFISAATTFAPGEPTDRGEDAFVHDLVTGETKLASTTTAGTPANSVTTGHYDGNIALSGDGRYLYFMADLSLDQRFSLGGSGLLARDVQFGPGTCALPWGGTLANGQSVTAYSAATRIDCSAASEVRVCADGVLSGSFPYAACENPGSPLLMVFPNGGETLAVGTKVRVSWESAGYAKSQATIFLSKKGGKAFAKLAGGLKNTGMWSWKVNRRQASGQAVLRVCLSRKKQARRACDDSDGTFLIQK